MNDNIIFVFLRMLIKNHTEFVRHQLIMPKNNTVIRLSAPDIAIIIQYFLMSLQYSQKILMRQNFQRWNPEMAALPESMRAITAADVAKSQVIWAIKSYKI